MKLIMFFFIRKSLNHIIPQTKKEHPYGHSIFVFSFFYVKAGLFKLKSSFSCKAGNNEGIVSYFGFFPTKQMNEEKASLPKFGLIKHQPTRMYCANN
ncbi:hypothetical protein [Persicobacter diffluens]|uniref:Uncharacterized protein n=1 Tax=Persicobacter diffluens TaxID=981 RepID=A0AAN4W102_9BACT|nr:hypothetical protein PEDI_28790 [Persicobacter diffluens]